VLQEGRLGRHADEELKFGVSGAQPEEADEDGEDDGAGGIDPPTMYHGQQSLQPTVPGIGRGVADINFEPPILVNKPKPLMNKSFR
jgi:hypothetical protein